MKNYVPLPPRLRRALAPAVALACLALPAAIEAKEYCCPCDGGESVTVDERNSMMASMKCSLICSAPVRAESGACPAAAPSAPAAAATTVLLFGSTDCSGEAVELAASSGDLTGRIAGGAHSFRVASGAAASVWSDTRHAGVRTAPVGPSYCVSPGFEIRSLHIGGD
jgi:hypothetical protein